MKITKMLLIYAIHLVILLACEDQRNRCRIYDDDGKIMYDIDEIRLLDGTRWLVRGGTHSKAITCDWTNAKTDITLLKNLHGRTYIPLGPHDN